MILDKNCRKDCLTSAVKIELSLKKKSI